MNGLFYFPYNFVRQVVRTTRHKLGRLKSIILKNSVSIHPTTWKGLRARIETIGGGSVRIGKCCSIHDYALILTHGGNIKIGNNVSIHEYAILYGHGGLVIGNNVRIAARVIIIPANHIFKDKETPIRLQGIAAKGITIGDDVWLGADCKILDGVTIGKGCVIGAGSVVTESLPEYSIAVGVPAKIISKRGEVKQ